MGGGVWIKYMKNLRDAFEHFTEEIKDNMIDITNTAVKNITSKISILAKESPIPATKPKVAQPSQSDTTPAALADTPEEDPFSHLILAAPTVDISNQDTSKLSEMDNIEVYKQKVIVSCQNIFAVAQKAIESKPELRKVVIMQHHPRHDVPAVDPTGLKPKLARFANSSLVQMWENSSVKDRIVIGKHDLECSGDMINARYRDSWSGRYDGVHLYNRQGRKAYTESVLCIVKSVIITKNKTTTPPPSSPPPPSPHNSCPQAQFQNRQNKNTTSGHQSASPAYTVPVSNQFDVLGNC